MNYLPLDAVDFQDHSPIRFQNHSPTFSRSFTHPLIRTQQWVCRAQRGGCLCMAYREVRVMDIEQVIRRWTAGEAIRAIARTTGLDRNTVRRLIRLAEKAGLKAGNPVTEEQLQLIRKGIGQPGASPESSEAEQNL